MSDEWSYWMQNAMGATHTLVDMGKVDEKSVRDATDRVKAAIGRGGSVQVVGSGRVTLRISPRKVEKTLAEFPQIVAGADRALANAQARDVTNSRVTGWRRRHRQMTWLELRVLFVGLRETARNDP